LAFGALSCSTTLEATFEIITEAVEEIERTEDVRLNPLGDSLRVTRDADWAELSWEGGKRALRGGELVEIRVEEIQHAPGSRSAVRVDGREVFRADGHIHVRLRWRIRQEKVLPPLVWKTSIRLAPGESQPVNQIVMYSGASESKFRKLRTRTRFSGPDRQRFTFTPSGPLRDGRVAGTIRAQETDGR
jgi:hypothetical protein